VQHRVDREIPHLHLHDNHRQPEQPGQDVQPDGQDDPALRKGIVHQIGEPDAGDRLCNHGGGREHEVGDHDDAATPAITRGSPCRCAINMKNAMPAPVPSRTEAPIKCRDLLASLCKIFSAELPRRFGVVMPANWEATMGDMHPAIPRVLCPSCGKIMTLRRIAPDDRDRPAMHFACDCGFDYRMSARARGEAMSGI
jgi:hypothetical protein